MKPGKNNINDKKHTSPPLMKGPSVKTYKLKANVEPKQILKGDAPIQELQKLQELQKPTEVEKVETHESIKFILIGLTASLVTLALYLN
jgi:hypothetical protein